MSEQELLSAISEMMDKKLEAEREFISGMMDRKRNEELKTELEPIKADLQELGKKISEIERHLENVTDKIILTAAKGHVRINNKLDDALKSESWKLHLMIRVNYMEDELRKIKDRLDQIA